MCPQHHDFSRKMCAYRKPDIIFSIIIITLFFFGTTAVATNDSPIIKDKTWIKHKAELDLCTELNIQFVSVAAPGNEFHPKTGYGRVDYVYEISKYEISNKQWAIFLNAVARYKDPFGLFNENMQVGIFGGIERRHKGKTFFYMPKDGMQDLPVVYISWWDAVRFCNWLEFGCPSIGNSGPGVTEGTVSSGSYHTSEWKTSVSVLRNPTAHYFIPSRNEWDKAAYFDPMLPPPCYWIYPIRMDELPTGEVPPGSTRSANVFDGHFAVPYPHLTPVGAYRATRSPWGTFDQAGNVWEWTDTLANPNNPNDTNLWVRGGAATAYPFATAITNNWSEGPDHELYIFGFRVVRIPHGQVIQSRRSIKKTSDTFSRDRVLVCGNVVVWLINIFIFLAIRSLHNKS